MHSRKDSETVHQAAETVSDAIGWRLDALSDRLEKAVANGSSSTSGIHIHGGGVIALVVAAIGILGIVVAVAAVFVVAAWRSADMAALAQARGDVRELQAYKSQHERRINQLEAYHGDAETK